MNAPFGFRAFLGVASLIGVIVSHIIVLFDFIEEKRVEGESLEDALLDAGIMRLRPVLITVAATVIALFPLAAHGGPLWEPMCYTQIGGLSVAPSPPPPSAALRTPAPEWLPLLARAFSFCAPRCDARSTGCRSIGTLHVAAQAIARTRTSPEAAHSF